MALALFEPALVMLDNVSATHAIAASAYAVSFADTPLKAVVLTPLLVTAPLLAMHAAYRDVFGKR